MTQSYDGPIELRWKVFTEWPNKGFVSHMNEIIHADNWCDGDFICHVDSDCFFYEPVTPDTYFQDGKPILMYSSFDYVCERDNTQAYRNWKTAVERAIGGVCNWECMRRHPAVHYRKTYEQTRSDIAAYTGKRAEQHISEQRSTFPQTFAEFPTLGEVAWRHFRKDYHWINQETDPHPPDPLAQCWSHGPMDKPQGVQLKGKYGQHIPMELIRKAGL